MWPWIEWSEDTFSGSLGLGLGIDGHLQQPIVRSVLGADCRIAVIDEMIDDDLI